VKESESELLCTDSTARVSTLCWHSPGLRSFLNVRDQVSRSYKTAGKIIVLYVVNFMLLGGKREDER
jgi:hypothetical protein